MMSRGWFRLASVIVAVATPVVGLNTVTELSGWSLVTYPNSCAPSAPALAAKATSVDRNRFIGL